MYLYTGDGLILWLCLQDHERIALRRMGWRFSQSRWQSGLWLGQEASSDLVIAGALLPAKSARLVQRGTMLVIEPREACIAPLEGEIPALCSKKPLSLQAGEGFRLYAQGMGHYAAGFRWQRAAQASEGWELWLDSATGMGSSSRLLSKENLARSGMRGFLIARADAYFRDVMPDTVKTLDLESKVHALVLQGWLHYLDAKQLRQRLSAPPDEPLPLASWLHEAPAPAMQRLLSPLENDAFLRARLSAANQALARGASTQARSLFRIQSAQAGREGALLGLGIGASTLQTPRRNLLLPQSTQRHHKPDLRLQIALTTRSIPRPYLEDLDHAEAKIPQRLIYPYARITELLYSAKLPKEAKERAFSKVYAIAHGRSLLWSEGALWQSPHPYARLPLERSAAKKKPPTTPNHPVAPSTAPDGQEKEPSEKKETDTSIRFLYPIKGRWWQRERDRQRSSTSWPLDAIARRLAQNGRESELAERLRTLNKAQIREEAHCGNQSRREGGRWQHRKGCWEKTTLFAEGATVLVPCDESLLESLRKRHCKRGQPSIRLDQAGKPILPALSESGAIGALLIQEEANQENPAPSSAQAPASPTAQAPKRLRWWLQKRGAADIRLNQQILQDGERYPLRDGDLIKINERILRVRQQGSIVAHSRYQGDQIIPVYPQGATYAHLLAGSVGGIYRSDPAALRAQIPPPPQGKDEQPRKIALTLHPDLQQIAFQTGLLHLSRMDSPAFQRRFRRRFLRNPHKPHAGAILLLQRKTGEILAASSYPPVDPNLPEEDASLHSDHSQPPRYLRPQILDRFGLTTPLLAYQRASLPPDPPDHSPQTGRPASIPSLLEALAWDREEDQRGLRPLDRSGWLVERALYGSQTPGSTIKILTAIAYARFLRAQGKPVVFPKHRCAGGLMFQLPQRTAKKKTHPKENKDHKTQDAPTSWRPSSIHFRCNKREGHGLLDLQQALAVSCNAYFAKLALAMGGIPHEQLERPPSAIRWHSSRYGGSGRYEMLQIKPDALSDALRQPLHRTLWRTAAQLGFSMQYTYRREKRPSVVTSIPSGKMASPPSNAPPPISPPTNNNRSPNRSSANAFSRMLPSAPSALDDSSRPPPAIPHGNNGADKNATLATKDPPPPKPPLAPFPLLFGVWLTSVLDKI